MSVYHGRYASMCAHLRGRHHRIRLRGLHFAPWLGVLVGTEVAVAVSMVDICARLRSIRSPGFRAICTVSAGKHVTPRSLAWMERDAARGCEEQEAAMRPRESMALAGRMVGGWGTREDDSVLWAVKAVLIKDGGMQIGFDALVEFGEPRGIAPAKYLHGLDRGSVRLRGVRRGQHRWCLQHVPGRRPFARRDREPPRSVQEWLCCPRIGLRRRGLHVSRGGNGSRSVCVRSSDVLVHRSGPYHGGCIVRVWVAGQQGDVSALLADSRGIGNNVCAPVRCHVDRSGHCCGLAEGCPSRRPRFSFLAKVRGKEYRGLIRQLSSGFAGLDFDRESNREQLGV
jgi:hypothetical protein